LVTCHGGAGDVGVGIGRELDGPDGDVVGLDVVRVPVGAALVVGDDDLRPDPADDRGEPPAASSSGARWKLSGCSFGSVPAIPLSR
jgi:hypothetical protein